MSLTLSRADVSGSRDEALSSVHNQGFQVLTRSTTDIAASSTTTTLIDQSSDPLLSSTAPVFTGANIGSISGCTFHFHFTAMWKLSRMKGNVGLLSIAMRTIDFEAIFYQLVQFWINFHSFTWHRLDPYFVTKKNCFSQIPLQSVFEVLFKLMLDDFTFNKFVFRTRGTLLLSELLSSSRIRHGGSPLSASHQKCILLSEIECHIINNLLTELARAVLENIGPPSWQRANIPQYGTSKLG